MNNNLLIFLCLLLISCSGNKVIIIGFGVVETENSEYVDYVNVNSLGIDIFCGDIHHISVGKHNFLYKTIKIDNILEYADSNNVKLITIDNNNINFKTRYTNEIYNNVCY